MNTANNTNTGGSSAPGDDIGDELMSEVASKLGTQITKTEKPAGGGEGGESAGGGEGGEDAGENGDEGEGGESQGAEGASESEGAEGEGGEGEGGEETAEEKAERERAEAEAAKNNPGKADKDAAAKELAAKLKDAAPEVRKAAQAVVDQIIDSVVVKERAEKERLGSRVTELTTELEAAQKAKGPMVVGTINPVFMADDAATIDQREDAIEQFERWAAKGIREGGVNLPDKDGYDETKPTYTVEQIENRLEQVLHEKKKILPAARANLQKRAEIDKALRDIYPAIFDPKTEEYAQVQQVLKVLPELKQFADYRVIALKQILGDRALADLLAKRKKESSPKGNDKKQATPPKKTPPRAPGNGSPAKGSVLDPKSKQTAAPTAVKKVMADPTNKQAFKDAVGALVSDL